MYVCLCHAVTDSDIRDAVDNGVRNMRQLARKTGCSSNCGKCAATAVEVLSEAVESSASLLRVVSTSQAA